VSATEETKPVVDIPFAEALQELTGWEMLGIGKRYGQEFNDLGPLKVLMGTIWSYENRTAKTEWSHVERMTLSQLEGYFAQPDPDPESDQGEGSAS